MAFRDYDLFIDWVRDFENLKAFGSSSSCFKSRAEQWRSLSFYVY